MNSSTMTYHGGYQKWWARWRAIVRKKG